MSKCTPLCSGSLDRDSSGKCFCPNSQEYCTLSDICGIEGCLQKCRNKEPITSESRCYCHWRSPCEKGKICFGNKCLSVCPNNNATAFDSECFCEASGSVCPINSICSDEQNACVLNCQSRNETIQRSSSTASTTTTSSTTSIGHLNSAITTTTTSVTHTSDNICFCNQDKTLCNYPNICGNAGCLENCLRNIILDGECYCGEQMCNSTEVCYNDKCLQVCLDESITSSTCYCMHSHSNCSRNSVCNKDEGKCLPVCESINSQIETDNICHCQKDNQTCDSSKICGDEGCLEKCPSNELIDLEKCYCDKQNPCESEKVCLGNKCLSVCPGTEKVIKDTECYCPHAENKCPKNLICNKFTKNCTDPLPECPVYPQLVKNEWCLCDETNICTTSQVCDTEGKCR